MKICFLDLQENKRGVANRDQTGGYGSTMRADGFSSSYLRLSWFKKHISSIIKSRVNYISFS